MPDGDDFEADPLGPRYRLTGHKMWISAGAHELTENIVHLVLAKVPGPDGRLVPGTRGISLFVVPKRLVDAQGCLTGERNDVVLAGLNHKCGWRGTTNTLLNFGEGRHRPGGRAGAVGYRVGREGEGLRCMFHMMNEARIGVGLCAAMLGMAGYEAALAYARQRPQGRPITGAGKDASQPQVPIIGHADVKRMLLAQKAYAEGALALLLRCARLVDEQHTGEPQAARDAALLLEVLTPVAKSWPSEWCLEGNSLAIQVHGGYGYTRDFPVEQYWRDQRLNMIHEGTHGIQALDLLGRKVVMDAGGRPQLLATHIGATAERGRSCRRSRSGSQCAGRGAAVAGRGHQGRLGHRGAGGGAGQCHALPAGVRPRGAGLDLARPGTGLRRPPRRRVRGAACGDALFLQLRAAQGGRVARRGGQPRRHLSRHARGLVLMPAPRECA